MLQSEFEQLQPVISTLFDIDTIALTDDPANNTELLLQTALDYGRKLIEITQKLDQFHNRTANKHETQTYNRILDLYKECGFKDEGNQTEQAMLERIRMELKRSSESKKSVYSKSETKRTKKEVEFTKKEMASIREGMKKSEELWKQIYMKMEQISDRYCQDRRFDKSSSSRAHEEQLSFPQSLKDNISMNQNNLLSVSAFLDNLKHSLPEARNSKVNQLIHQIEERANVFSYSMSKLMQSIRSLKNPMNKNIEQIHENITSLVSKVFDIYPHAHLLRALQLKEEPMAINIKQYLNNSKEVQCNIKVDTKKDGQIKNLNLVLYRSRVRVQQILRKIQASIRMKKQVESKQIDKYLEELREASAHTENIQYQQVKSFEEELKNIALGFEQKQSEFREELQKSVKKATKSLHAYEEELKALKAQIENTQSNTQKLNKKIQTEKQQKQKLKQRLAESEKMAAGLQQELERTKQKLRQEHSQQLKQQKLLKAQYHLLIQQKKKNQEEHSSLVSKLKLQETVFEEERGAFISKVKRMEEKYEQLICENTETKQCLEQMIGDNKLLKDKLQEFTLVHEDKIHQCQAIATEYATLQKQLEQWQLEIKQGKISMVAQKSLISSLEKELEQAKQRLQKVLKQKQSTLAECNRYKQLGKLNQDDIEALKQQFEKVHKAYIDVEAENSYLKSNLDSVTVQHAKITEIQQRCNSIIQERQTEIRQLKRQLSEYQDQNKFLKEEAKLKESQFQELIKNSQLGKQQKKQTTRLKREVTEVRNSLATAELQYNIAKQQLQNMIQEQEAKKSMQKSEVKAASTKYQVQIQSLKMELKGKKEGWQKQKMNYEREKELYVQKIEELSRLLQQKQSLSNRIKAFR